MQKRSVVMSSVFSGFILHDVMEVCSKVKASEGLKKTHQLEMKIDMNKFKSIWGLMLGI
jgi:hypothetical protein